MEELFKPRARSIVHLLETDLDAFLEKLAGLDAAREGLVTHKNLPNFAYDDDREGRTSDVIVAGWPDIVLDSSEALAAADRERLARFDELPDVSAIESKGMWEKAVFLANNPVYNRVIALALKDTQFLHGLRVTSIGEEMQHHLGADEPPDHVVDVAERQARKTARRLSLIHSILQKLKHSGVNQGTVALPDSDPYARLAFESKVENSIVVIRPYFSRIEMRFEHSEWEGHDSWFNDRVAGYKHFNWTP